VLRVHRPGHWLDPGPFGCLGVGPPFALGVKAAKPDKQVVVVANLEPAKLRGVESQGMVLAASEGERVVLLRPDEPVAPGAVVR